MNPLKIVKRYLHNIHRSTMMSEEIREGVKNQSALLNDKMNELIHAVRQLTHTLGGSELAASNMSSTAAGGHVNDGYQAPPTSNQSMTSSASENVADALKKHPLIFAPRTYNTNHPDYDVNVVRNFPGKIFNADKDDGSNVVYNELKKMARKNEIPESAWSSILRKSLDEARSVPHAEQVFERKEFVEKYLDGLRNQHNAHYNPGWVNLEDALFLYWTVRHLKPKRIVQAGVCNGLSSAFMMLALAKNGPDGTLHVVDMPPIFDSTDPNWKIRNKVYGVVIPEGKSSGWLVPDAYRDRFEVLNGDAKDLLPGLLKKVGSIDMFYHDSDHTYDHMMFEFIESKKYLTPHGVIVSDDISWNASLWDFADQYMVPAYNYRGSMGIACF